MKKRDAAQEESEDVGEASFSAMWSHSVAAADPLPTPRGGFVFTCNGRGQEFHNEAEAESKALARALPGCAMAGFYAGGEYGPGETGMPPGLDLPDEGVECHLNSFSCVVATIS